MTRATVEFAKGLHLHNGPETAIDDAITMRGELAAVRAQLDAANRRNQVLAADLARVALENAAMASALSKANHTADELRYQLSLASRADEGMAMRALRAAATQAGIVAIACEFSEGSITLTEAINRAQGLADATPLTLTDRGAGDGYCAYQEEE